LDVEEIMIKKVVRIASDATVKDAANLMNHHDIGCLIVADDGRVSGIVTERDVLRRVVAASKDPEETSVSDVMSKPLIVGGPSMYVEDAARQMFRKNIKKLPIVENGELVGMLTLSDIARVADVNPQVAKVVGDLKKAGWLPTRKMKKVIDFYIA
jgi:CBS domain-containing protein